MGDSRWIRLLLSVATLLLLVGCTTEVVDDNSVDTGPAPPDLKRRPWGLSENFLQHLAKRDYEKARTMVRGEPESFANEDAFLDLAKRLEGSIALNEEIRGGRATVVLGPNSAEPKVRLIFRKQYEKWKIRDIRQIRKKRRRK